MYQGESFAEVVGQDNMDSTEMENVIVEVSMDSSSSQETEKHNSIKPIYSRKRILKKNFAKAMRIDKVKKMKAVRRIAKPQTIEKNNEFDIFGQSVAAQLNAMPLIDALQAQTYIQKYLTTIRVRTIRQLSSESRNYSPSPTPSTTYLSTPSPNREAIYTDILKDEKNLY